MCVHAIPKPEWTPPGAHLRRELGSLGTLGLLGSAATAARLIHSARLTPAALAAASTRASMSGGNAMVI